jgi:hypothetical protein
VKTPLRRLLLPGLGVLFALGALAWLVGAGCCVDHEITKPVETRDLTRDEIRAKLTSSEFRDKLAGEKQIDKLPPDEKLRILLGLSRDSDPAVRLIAAKHLLRIDVPEARERLAQMSQSDLDSTVREVAGGK